MTSQAATAAYIRFSLHLTTQVYQRHKSGNIIVDILDTTGVLYTRKNNTAINMAGKRLARQNITYIVFTTIDVVERQCTPKAAI